MKTAIVLALFGALAAGCAGSHSTMRGSVVMRVSDSEAHVCMGSGEVSVGDRVNVVRHKCVSTTDQSVAATERCKREVVGTGQVVEVLNSHYSVVRFAPGVVFAESDSIEKMP